jgi:two-component system, LytTR family, sensor kinase
LIFSGGDQSFIYKYFLPLYAVILLISNYLTYLIIFKIKDQTKWFLIIGSLTIGWAVGYEVYNVFVNGSPKPRDFFYTLPSGFMHFSFVELSYVIESLIFLMGINFKNLRKEKENKALKERVIEQLKEKESLEKQVNQLLKDKLKNSEEQLQTELINSEYEQNKVQLLQSQLSSLQLQMNPHYLFNSLNSINDFIISKKPKEASEYLALYARMMRSILRNSDQTFNSLAQELQFCKDYLELEALRFEDRFKYQIIEPSKTSFLDKNIPGMMLQPILENAVWHGIMPKKGEGIIVLDCSQTTLHRIIIEISDNGSGLKTSDSAKMKESYGLKNINEKITLIQKLYSINIEFEIMNNPESSGVMVRFVFPEIENINLTQ